MGSTLALIAALYLFFEHTLAGKALRATAVNRLGARLVARIGGRNDEADLRAGEKGGVRRGRLGRRERGREERGAVAGGRDGGIHPGAVGAHGEGARVDIPSNAAGRRRWRAAKEYR